ncbi:flagellin [Sphingomonas yabuuchiae]|uniref:flagellin N-terminal helical domain-containing protein n=1 Tax=Sphingomonas yabuuchiae TaxID=172044 RepID=UPI003D996AED
MTVINTNGAALRAMAATQRANTDLAQSMARMSSGQRINSAKDDAAGLAISSSMTAQIRGMTQGIRNAMDGVSLVQTADGVLTEVSNMLQRVRELAVQAGSGTYSENDRAALDREANAITTQITETLTKASFNGVNFFDTELYRYGPRDLPPKTGTSVAIQAGPSGQADNISIDIPPIPTYYNRRNSGGLTSVSMSASSQKHLITFDDYIARGSVAGRSITIKDVGNIVTQNVGDQWYSSSYASSDSSTYHTTSIDGQEGWWSERMIGMTEEMSVANPYRAENTLKRVDELLQKVNNVQGQLGATANRLQSAVSTLTSGTTNLSEARSRIADTDYSEESVKLARAQILAQASTAMLAQANQSQKDVLKLLGQ